MDVEREERLKLAGGQDDHVPSVAAATEIYSTAAVRAVKRALFEARKR